MDSSHILAMVYFARFYLHFLFTERYTLFYFPQDVLHMGIADCLEVRKSWERRPQKERAEIFAAAAELMSNKYRYDLLATTMLGQVGFQLEDCSGVPEYKFPW